MNDLALDNLDLREQNTKRLLDNVDKIGNSFEEQRKAARTNKYYLIVMGIIALVLIGGSFIAIIWSGGVSSLFNGDYAANRYFCWNNETNVTFRIAQDAIDFKTLLGNETTKCRYYHV